MKIFFYLVIGVILIGGIGFKAVRNKRAPSYETVEVTRQTLREEVSVAGQVVSLQAVDLSFEVGGRIAASHVKVGDAVAAGQILATLANADEAARLRQAEATVASAMALEDQYAAAVAAAEAKLNALKAGTRPEEISVAETAVANAAKALADAEIANLEAEKKALNDLAHLHESIADVLQDVSVTAEKAVNAELDNLFLNDTIDPKLSFSVSNFGVGATAEAARSRAGALVSTIGRTASSLPIDALLREAALGDVKGQLDEVRRALADVTPAIDASVGLASASSAAYKASVSTARTNVTAAIAKITAHEQAIATEKVTNASDLTAAQTAVNAARQLLATRQSELALKQAPATKEDIEKDEASVKQAKANLASQSAQVAYAVASRDASAAAYGKTVLRAPIAGLVTKQDAKTGEHVSAGTTLIRVMSPDTPAVEAYVSEGDIGKVSAGDPSDVTLDAYGQDVIFPASIVSIDPSETEIDGVSTYKVTAQFTEPDERIRSGMTANLDIATETREDALALPVRAIRFVDGQATVEILGPDAKSTSTATVTIGIRSADGYVEIVSGFEAEDVVVVSRGE